MKTPTLLLTTLFLSIIALPLSMIQPIINEVRVEVKNDVNGTQTNASSNDTNTHIEIETNGKKEVYDSVGDANISVESHDGVTTINVTKYPEQTNTATPTEKPDEKEGSPSASPTQKIANEENEKEKSVVIAIVTSAVAFLFDIPMFFVDVFFN